MDLSASPGKFLIDNWQRAKKLPGGAALFNFLLSRKVPYSGTIGARVLYLARGTCTAQLRDRRRVRNHLSSIHAVALINFGELTTGLTVLSALEPNIRGIVIELGAHYYKKARGTLIAEANCEIPEFVDSIDFPICCSIKDAEQDVVAEVKSLWRLSRVQS